MSLYYEPSGLWSNWSPSCNLKMKYPKYDPNGGIQVLIPVVMQMWSRSREVAIPQEEYVVELGPITHVGWPVKWEYEEEWRELERYEE